MSSTNHLAPESCFRESRLSQGLTLDQVAYQTGVPRLVVLRNEQGFFAAPNLKLLNHFYVHDDHAAVLEAYREFQRETRRFNFGRLEPLSPTGFSARLPVGKHPLAWWRENSSPTALPVSINSLCRYFCLHQGMLSKFDTMPWAVNEVPPQFSLALIEAGYSPKLLDAFSDAYSSYRTYLRGRPVVNVNASSS